MVNFLNKKISLIVFYMMVFSLSGCASNIATYDKVAYEKAVSLKVDSLSLMSKATNTYSKHKEEAKKLLKDIEKAYEYAKGRPKNGIITRQWRILKDAKRNLVGGFIARWESKGTLSDKVVTGSKSNVSLAFDQIIGLESGLIKPKK